MQGIARRALLLPCEPRCDPLGEPRALDRIDVDDDALRFERFEPRRRLAGPVQPRQRHQGEGIGRQLRAERLDRLGAVAAGLAGDKAQLDQLFVAEERKARAACAELVPVETALRGEHQALGKPVCARPRADRVAGFQREQRLVAVYHIQRPELALEVRLQLFEPQIGHAFGAYSVWVGTGFAATRRRRICCTMSLCMSR